jgi:DNA polymerase (family 10)
MRSNREIAALFAQIAEMLSIRGDSIHRVLAYQRASENITELGRDLAVLHAEGRLTDIPGIGATLAEKIEEILTTGKLEFYDRLAAEIPPTLTQLLRVDGLGPKRVKAIYDTLGITTLEELQQAAQKGELRKLPGMGATSEAKLLKAIESLARHQDDRIPLEVAWSAANQILAALTLLPGVTQSAVGGSLRRMRETIGDIDLMLAAGDAEAIMSAFCAMENVESVLGKGPTKSSVILLNGVRVQLRVLPEERWGTLLSYFTGSQAHNVRLRELALKHGMTLNEHEFRALDGEGKAILCATEEEVYRVLGLPYIAPPLREDRGEIEAAQAGKLPALVEEKDLIADLHMHTNWSDGSATILEMAQAARRNGLQYIVISDHSASLGIANGLSVERLRQQAAEIRQANEAMGPDFRIFHGTEMEIRTDGTLDYPDDVLAELDFVIGALHIGLNQSREQVTRRALAAIDNPHVNMLAHPTGRLLPERSGADLDMDAILYAASRTGTILEVNANPRRLDLRDAHVRRAIELGVRIAINTDAHHPDHFGFRHFGVATAQRGWAEARDVVNSWPLAQFAAFLQQG